MVNVKHEDRELHVRARPDHPDGLSRRSAGDMQTFTFGAFTEQQECAFRIRLIAVCGAVRRHGPVSAICL